VWLIEASELNWERVKEAIGDQGNTHISNFKQTNLG